MYSYSLKYTKQNYEAELLSPQVWLPHQIANQSKERLNPLVSEQIHFKWSEHFEEHPRRKLRMLQSMYYGSFYPSDSKHGLIN